MFKFFEKLFKSKTDSSRNDTTLEESLLKFLAKEEKSENIPFNLFNEGPILNDMSFNFIKDIFNNEYTLILDTSSVNQKTIDACYHLWSEYNYIIQHGNKEYCAVTLALLYTLLGMILGHNIKEIKILTKNKVLCDICNITSVYTIDENNLSPTSFMDNLPPILNIKKSGEQVSYLISYLKSKNIIIHSELV